MRQLIVIRIVHSPSDMGSASKGLEKESITKVGQKRWDDNLKRIEKFWDELEKEIADMSLDLTKVRIYQDGMPTGGEFAKHIVNKTAEMGSRNYQIIKKLMDAGATVEQTESPELLQLEYSHIKSILEAKSDLEKIDAVKRYDLVKDDLLKGRDNFIAASIGSTLKDDEIGLLLIGANHDVVSKLPSDIEVKLLD